MRLEHCWATDPQARCWKVRTRVWSIAWQAVLAPELSDSKASLRATPAAEPLPFASRLPIHRARAECDTFPAGSSLLHRALAADRRRSLRDRTQLLPYLAPAPLRCSVEQSSLLP